MLTAAHFAVLADSSVMEMRLRSTLHDVRAKSRKLRGSIEAAWNGDGSLSLEPSPTMHLEVPVVSLVSGNKTLDAQMQEMIGSRSFPNIVADLLELQATDKPNAYAAKGKIELRGTARTFSGTLAIKRDGERVSVEGLTTIDMREFGIKPPRLLVISVQPEVEIELRLVAGPG